MRTFSVGRFLRFGFVVFLVIMGMTVRPAPAGADGFRISDDAFSISNAPGYCFAMAAFSRWYFLSHQGEAPLRSVLDQTSQERIARELQGYYSRNLITLQADYCNRFHGNQAESFQQFVSGIVSGEPRIVLLMNKGSRGAVLHAVLAYDWLADRNMVKVYDPNYPRAERIIDMEKGDYTSLDITYHAICFPDVLNHHPGLTRKMENLYAVHVAKKRGPQLDRTAFNPRKRGYLDGPSSN